MSNDTCFTIFYSFYDYTLCVYQHCLYQRIFFEWQIYLLAVAGTNKLKMSFTEHYFVNEF